MSSNAVAIGLVRVTKVLVVVAGLGVSGDTHGRHSVEKRKRHGASSPVRLAASGETAQRAPHRYKSDRFSPGCYRPVAHKIRHSVGVKIA